MPFASSQLHNNLHQEAGDPTRPLLLRTEVSYLIHLRRPSITSRLPAVPMQRPNSPAIFSALPFPNRPSTLTISSAFCSTRSWPSACLTPTVTTRTTQPTRRQRKKSSIQANGPAAQEPWFKPLRTTLSTFVSPRRTVFTSFYIPRRVYGSREDRRRFRSSSELPFLRAIPYP